jgi:hypothetical protein
MKYKTFFRLVIKKEERVTFRKSLKAYNEKNIYELKAIEKNEDIYTLCVSSQDSLIGFETHQIAFEFGNIFRNYQIMY